MFLCISLSLAACGGSGGKSESGGSVPTLRVATDNLPASPILSCGMTLLTKELAGTINVKVFDSSQLGPAAKVLELVHSGEFEGTMVGPGQLQTFYAPISIFAAVYVIDDDDHAYRVWRGSVGEDLRAGLAKENLTAPGFFWYGTRQLTSNKPVRTPADLHGVRLRVSPGSQIAFVNGKAMGANPTTVAFADLYLALTQGVVDAQENPLPTIDDAKLYEGQKYLDLTNHEPDPQFLVVSKKFMDGLTADQRTAFDAAIGKAEAAARECTLKKEKDLLAKWKSDGTWKGGIIEDVDIDAFRAATKPVLLAEYDKVWGPLDLYNRVRAESQR